MNPYVNIHTHHLSTGSGVFVFNNRFAFDRELYTISLFSIGIHPWDAELASINVFNELERLITHANCFAIGECGLDKQKGPGLEIQKRVFEQQLELALKYHKPVIIHCVKAFDELIEICSSYIHKIPLIIHGFNKSSQLAKQLTEKGFYVSLNPTVFKKAGFNFNVIPLAKLFLETDTCKTDLISDVYLKASLKFNIETDELKKKIYNNFEALSLI